MGYYIAIIIDTVRLFDVKLPDGPTIQLRFGGMEGAAQSLEQTVQDIPLD